MFPQLHRAFIVDRSLCFFTGVIIFKIYPDINSMASLKNERRGRFFSNAPPFQVQIYKVKGVVLTFGALALRQSRFLSSGS